ncbi:hypothetical protein KSD_03690 [Ktedonobacter sp. SOSP1-85]|uniref:HNH endonuclease n=1 Tax=Ktedonobacter sp. SOSP1-85 TaxID=2778367 RepID=UPI001915E20E|nr:HNH endonuclease [Ktedonobacter sp. SOSP1-85]GHO72598.1 hypothetical protein KSD_03690 [Ktedonobacter sp. SOSP1-85]
MSDMSPTEHWYAYGDENGNGPWNEDVEPEYEVGYCQNCYTQLPLQQALRGALFCSEKCKQTANTIRYARATIKDGRYNDPLVRQAIEIRIALILGGGYPEKDRKLSPKQRETIFIRDNHTCRLCGKPATDIDHINGSSSNPSNLQALCKECNSAKAIANFRPATPEESKEGEAIWERINAEQPMQLCDNEDRWVEIYKEIMQENREWANSWWPYHIS